MSIKTIDDALDFLPESRKTPNVGARLMSAVTSFFAGVEQGLTARAHYQQLTARGMSPSQAARTVLIEDIKG